MKIKIVLLIGDNGEEITIAPKVMPKIEIELEGQEGELKEYFLKALEIIKE